MSHKVAIVTAASRGMGAACARKLAKADYKLVIMSRSDDIFPLANELDARPLQGSVDKPKDIDRLVNLAYEKYGRIDAIINNTGHPPKGELLTLSDADWEVGFNLILMNVVRMCRLAAPIMKENGGGSIINISTFGAKEPSLKFPISSVIRTALSSFTKLCAEMLGPDNIRINNILPGYIDSYPTDEETINDIPLLRQGKPDEVADLALFLLSDHATYITGQNVLIDGGLVKSI